MEWNAILFGNPPRATGIAAGIACALLLVLWALRTLLRHRFRDARSTPGDLDDFFLGAAERTKIALLLVPAIYAGSRVLILPAELAQVIVKAAELSLVAQVALWASGLVDFWIHRYRKARIETDPASATTLSVFRLLAVVTIWVVAVIVAIDNLGFNVTTLIAGLGIGGVAVALATQNILSDLFASLSIVVDKPFVVGESIGIDTLSGRVEHIGMKSTRLRSVDGEALIIGNADLLKTRIRNYSRMSERRAILRLLVHHNTTPDTVARIPGLLRAAIEKRPDTRFDRAHFVAIGDASLVFETAYFVTTPDHARFLDAQQAVNLDILRMFAAEKIELAWTARPALPAGA